MSHRPLSLPASTASDNDIVLDFGKIFGILKRGWWLIAGLGFIGALIAAVLVLRIEPTYRANAQLLMGQANRPGGTLGVLMQDLNLDDDAITGEIAVINSGRILSKVSTRLDLKSRPEFNPALRPPEPEPSFLAQLSNQAVDQLKSILGMTPPETDVEDPGETDAAVDDIETAARIGKDSLGDQADYVDRLKSGLRIGRVGNSNLVDVQFDSTDRLLAAAIPNIVVDIYLEDQLDRKFRALRRVTEGLEIRLNSMRERLEVSERAVIDYRTSNLLDGFGGQKQLDQQLADLSRRVGESASEQAELASDLAGIDALISDRGEVAAAGLFQSDLLERQQSQIIELRQREALLLDGFGPDSQQVRNISIEIARTESVIAAEVQRLRDNQAARVGMAAARVETLRQQLSDLENRAIEQAERDVRVAQFERDYAAERAVYTTFLDKFTQTSEVANLQEGDAQITTYADPPRAPIAPNKKLAVALGGIGGAFLGVGLIFLRVISDRAIRSSTQLSLLTGGAVFIQPRAQGLPLHRTNPLIAASARPRGPLSESVRSLRSHLMLSIPREKGGGKVVSFVSTRSGSGKTTSAILLARSFSQMGVSCVLVEADLRRSMIADRLGLSPRPDLVDLLKNEASWDQALQKDPESEAHILTARPGLADPAGILLSEAMTDLMQTLRQKFRVVIVDTAPLDLVSDAAPMVRLSDSVVLMVRYGVPQQDVESALYELDKLGPTQVLTVLSMVPRRSIKTYDHDYIT